MSNRQSVSGLVTLTVGKSVSQCDGCGVFFSQFGLCGSQPVDQLVNGRSVVVKVSQTAELTDGSIESFIQSDSGYAIQSDSGYVIRVCHSVRQWVSHNVIRSDSG